MDMVRAHISGEPWEILEMPFYAYASQGILPTSPTPLMDHVISHLAGNHPV